MTTTVYFKTSGSLLAVVDSIGEWFTARGITDGYCTHIFDKRCIRIADDKLAVIFVLTYNTYPIIRVETNELPITVIDW